MTASRAIILEQIAQAGAWLPITTVRQAFAQADSLIPVLLAAIQNQAGPPTSPDIRERRLAAFGAFFLAQIREHRLFEPLVCLFESQDPDRQDEWLFSERLFFFGHRLLAGICPLHPQALVDLAGNTALRPMTRSLALAAIGVQAAYGDVSRSDAVRQLRCLFTSVQATHSREMDASFARTAAKLHSRELEKQLQWFLASGRLDSSCRYVVGTAIQQNPDLHFLSILTLESMVDLFTNIFPRDIRDGELGLLPNSQIPSLELFLDGEPERRDN